MGYGHSLYTDVILNVFDPWRVHGACRFLVVSSLLLDQDVSYTVNLRELLTVQRGEQLPLTGQGRNKLLCQGDGGQTGHITECEGKIVKCKAERLAHLM